jgi:predicted acylesterase/phospholipase RssA
MERQSPQDLPAHYWYGTPGVIEHWFYGVFAGGGAKGIAYSGALLAMKEQNCWFIGVAGASAGAITAALVASGLSPEEMENATDSALRQVQTGIWAGLRRLQKATGYFPSDGLRVWLDDLFGTQVSRKTGTMHNVTFRQLTVPQVLS